VPVHADALEQHEEGVRIIRDRHEAPRVGLRDLVFVAPVQSSSRWIPLQFANDACQGLKELRFDQVAKVMGKRRSPRAMGNRRIDRILSPRRVRQGGLSGAELTKAL
jgi:hypothetical protein